MLFHFHIATINPNANSYITISSSTSRAGRWRGRANNFLQNTIMIFAQ
jgi:hypothetical protein